MIDAIVLDASPLSLLCNPDMRSSVVVEIKRWLRQHLASGATVYVPEIADYEVRRELVRAGKLRSIQRLDELHGQLYYLPLSSTIMRRAADLWAQARNQGRPTAPPEALDAGCPLGVDPDSASRERRRGGSHGKCGAPGPLHHREALARYLNEGS